MRYAIVDDSTKVVFNTILWDGESLYAIPDGMSIVSLEDAPCGPGWIQQPDGSFLPPSEDAS